jgi:hypothetical protein
MQGKKMGVRPAVAWWARRIAGRIVRERALFANASSHCQAPSQYRSTAIEPGRLRLERGCLAQLKNNLATFMTNAVKP